MSKRYRRERKALIDMGAIVHYFGLLVVFILAIWGMRAVIQYAISVSPTNQVGNGHIALYEVHNTGAAFNLFANQPEMIICVSFLAAAALVFVVLFFSSRLSNSAISAMALLTAGISMNLAERVTQGYVIDYIDCKFLPNFPMFNTADIMIVFGALGLILSLLTRD